MEQAETSEGRGGWGVISALFLVLVLVGGPNLTLAGVLFPPLLREFHWTHAQVARIAATAAFTTGVLGPVTGWLVDRIGARWLMAAGLLLIGLSDLAISTVHSLDSMAALFAIVGVGASLSGLIPMMVVAISWFKARRGIATGTVIAGLSTGMTISPPLVTWVIAHWGWRIVMRLLSLPIFFIVIPVVLMFVHAQPVPAQPGGATARFRADETARLPGLELAAALVTATFWMLFAGQFVYSVGNAAVFVHQITFLVGAGYSPEKAAWIFSSQTAFSGLGALVLGALADRVGPRAMLALAMFSHAVGVASLLATASPHLTLVWIVMFDIFWGMASGFGNLMPMLITETLGIRRLGTLMGVIGLCTAMASSFAPIVSGRLFDRTGSYTLPFELAMLLMVIGGTLISLVRPAAGRDRLPVGESAAEAAGSSL
jgi:MFS family permease